MAEKEKFTLEFMIKSSSRILYNCISTPSGLSEWFCDDVNIKDDIYTFQWDGAEEVARLLLKRSGELVRFQWLDDEEEGLETYFEMRIVIDPLTKAVALFVTDFAEPDEQEESTLLWNNQINELKHVLGS